MALREELKWLKREAEEKVGELWCVAEDLIIDLSEQMEKKDIQILELTQKIQRLEEQLDEK